MCLLAVAWKVHPDYPLAVCANRDEFYARPTQAAHFWSDFPDIYAGRDLQAGGSWMGINQKGRFAAVTNIRNPASNRNDAKSRGGLVSEFLNQDTTSIDYCNKLQLQGECYNGYNFLAFDGDSLVYQSNGVEQPQILQPGIYGLSNAKLNTPWPKTSSAINKLREWVNNPNSVDQLAQLLNDRHIVSDDRLPETGVSLTLERMLSAEFINSAEYGTRCSTGFLVHQSGEAEYCEISHAESAGKSQQRVEHYLPAQK